MCIFQGQLKQNLYYGHLLHAGNIREFFAKRSGPKRVSPPYLVSSSQLAASEASAG